MSYLDLFDLDQPDPKALKLASARPISADAKPILLEMRVSGNTVGSKVKK